MLLSPLVSIVVVGALYALWKAVKLAYRSYSSPLRLLPGPPSESLLFGNFKAILEAENSVLQEKWLEEYGDTIAYPGFLGVSPSIYHV